MPRFAANLSRRDTEHAFLDRFAAAAEDGFTAVEYLFRNDHAAAELASRLRASGLDQVLFIAPPGDWARDERGMACLPGREGTGVRRGPISDFHGHYKQAGKRSMRLERLRHR